MGRPLRSPVAKLSWEAANEENAKRRSFMPRTQVTGKANFSPGITSGLPVIQEQSGNHVPRADLNEAALRRTLRVRVGERCRCDRDIVGSQGGPHDPTSQNDARRTRAS